jgi:hypothetical protein
MKQCIKCKVIKKEDDFVYENKAKGIKHTVCSLCQREYKRKHYYKNKPAFYKRNEKKGNHLKS